MVAYVASASLGLCELEYLTVFRVTAVVSLLAYSAVHFSQSIWVHIPWANTWRNFVDGLIYAGVTACIPFTSAGGRPK